MIFESTISDLKFFLLDEFQLSSKKSAFTKKRFNHVIKKCKEIFHSNNNENIKLIKASILILFLVEDAFETFKKNPPKFSEQAKKELIACCKLFENEKQDSAIIFAKDNLFKILNNNESSMTF